MFFLALATVRSADQVQHDNMISDKFALEAAGSYQSAYHSSEGHGG